MGQSRLWLRIQRYLRVLADRVREHDDGIDAEKPRREIVAEIHRELGRILDDFRGDQETTPEEKDLWSVTLETPHADSPLDTLREECVRRIHEVTELTARLERSEEVLDSAHRQNRRLIDDNRKLRDEKAALGDVIADLKLDLKARE